MSAEDEIAQGAAWVGVGGIGLGTSLNRLLACDEIQPGSDPSYQLCKIIYTSHPLGGKMAEGPISLAQSQKREIAIQQAPDEVLKAFCDEWESLAMDTVIHNLATLSRVYGIASAGIIVDGDNNTGSPLRIEKIWDRDIAFNVWDPLNTSGSLIFNQIPTAMDFNKPSPAGVRVNGQHFHMTRTQTMLNEAPIYLDYNSAGFGFVGRSVYQRALHPLKAFVATMESDYMIARKLGLIIAKQKAPGSVVNRVMAFIAGIKRNLLKYGVTNNVLTIDVEEDASTFDMANTDGAGTYSRSNIIRNCETAMDAPAKFLDQETLSSGLADGTEDARIIARYIERIRMKLEKPYRWADNIVQYRAWSPPFYERMKSKYGSEVPGTFEDAFSHWRDQFSAVWPSLLIEPPSEKIKTDEVKLESIMSLWTALLPTMDPANQVKLIMDGLDNVNENEQMFAHKYGIDEDSLLEFLEEKQQREATKADTEIDTMANPPAPPQPKKLAAVGGSR